MVDINSVIDSVNISCIEGLLRQIEIGLLQDSSLPQDFLAYIGLTLSHDLAWFHDLPWFHDLTPPNDKKEPTLTSHTGSKYPDAKPELDIEKEKRACDDEAAEALIDHGDEILEKICEKKSEFDIKEEEKSNCDKKEEKKNKVDLTDVRPIISFTPEKWGQIKKFILFHNSSYSFSRDVNSALYGVEGHFGKYMTLMGLAKRLAPELNKDYEELIEKGYSQVIHSKELAAIIDSLFSELYSSVDCTRRVIAAIYGKYQGITSKSTSGLFKNAGKQIIDKRVPLEIRKALEDGQNDWFPKLKEIRDSLNHYNVGCCSDLEGRKNGELEPKISYYHDLLGNDLGNVLVTDDILKTLSDYEVKVNTFLGSVYHALNHTLEDKETVQVCGVFNGRFYQRFVSPYKAIDFNSGRCMSRQYFDKVDMPACPFVNVCGAYVKPEDMDF